MRNPFRFGPPVFSTDFFGREQIIDEMLSRVAQGQPCSIVGERRVGKTSLLLHIAHPSFRDLLESKMGPVLVVYLDFQGHRDLTVETFWRELIKEIVNQARIQDSAEHIHMLLEDFLRVDRLNIADVRRAFVQFAQVGTRLLLLFDEFEYVADSNALDVSFFGGLRSLVASNLPVTCITASRKSLSEIDRFTSGYSFVSSPFFNVFTTFRLGTFEEREAKHLLHELLNGTGMEFDADDIMFLYELSGYHPFFLQMAAYYLFEESKRRSQLSDRERRLSAQTRFDRQCHAHFDYYWTNSTDIERTVLSAYALDRQQITERSSEAQRIEFETAVQSLADRALLVPNQNRDGTYRLVSTSFADWIRETTLTGVRPRTISLGPESFKLLPRDGVRFEALVRQLLEAMGYHILEKAIVDADSRPDILAERVVKDVTVERHERVVVECKHYAHSGKAVSSRDIRGWQDAMASHEASGYLLVTDTRVTENLARLFRKFNQDEANYPRRAAFWDVDELIGYLNEYPDVRDTFFPVEETSRYVYVERPSHLFICYKRNADRDQKLANYLYEFLTSHGHNVFIDGTLRTGETWLEEVDRQIKASDFLVVLLSKESADSEMVHAEVQRAYEYRKLHGRPRTLLVRMTYEGPLPYPIDAFLAPLTYASWESEADNERVAQDILAAIEGRLPERTPIQAGPVAEGLIISEDGRPVADDEALLPPLPKFDPRFLHELEAPGGAVTLRDRFYVEREADIHLKHQIVKPGTTTTIRAPRQTGKTSLLMRGVHYARKKGAKVASIDFQGFGSEQLASADIFLRELAESICYELHLDEANLEKAWRGSQGVSRKLTYYLEDYVLSEFEGPVILAMDEADRLLQTPYYRDFFSLVRSWHNRRASHSQWEKLNIVMVISTEPYLLIDDIHQSPFNVGLNLELEDFNEAQVRHLNRQHGSPVRESDLPQLMELLNGHPYLTRKALYTLVTERWTWADLVRVAATDQGPFSDHLRHHHWLLRDAPDLKEALKEIIRHNRCTDEMALFRLLQAGLVKGSGDVYTCRCDLYRRYFEDKL